MASGLLPAELCLRNGKRVVLRAVRPEDGEELRAVMKRLSDESRYTRFMHSVREASPQMLERAVHPDPSREFQLVAAWTDAAREVIVGGARYSAAAGRRDCEFAITIVDDWQGTGIARPLLETLMSIAHDRGFERMEGYILSSNARMLGLAKRLGFERVESPEEPTVRFVRRDLTRPAL